MSSVISAWFAEEWKRVEGDAKRTGSSLVSGLVSGFEAGRAGLEAAVSSTARSVVSWFRERFQIHSPSLVMIELGASLAEGLAIGMTSKIGSVAAASAAVSDSLKKQAARKQVGRSGRGGRRDDAAAVERAVVGADVRADTQSGDPIRAAVERAHELLATHELTAAQVRQVHAGLAEEIVAINRKSAERASKVWQAHVERLATLNVRMSSMMASMRSGIASDEGRDREAGYADALNAASDRLAQRFADIDQWSADSGLAPNNPRAVAAKYLAQRENAADIAKATADYQRSIGDAQRALADNQRVIAEFTLALDRQKASYDRMGRSGGTDALAELSDTLAEVHQAAQDARDRLTELAQKGPVNYSGLLDRIDAAEDAGVAGAETQYFTRAVGDSLQAASTRLDDYRSRYEGTEDYGAASMSALGLAPETLGEYISNLQALMSDVEAQKPVTPEQLQDQARLLLEIVDRLSALNEGLESYASRLERFFDRVSDVAGADLGESVTRALEQIQTKHHKGKSGMQGFLNDIRGDVRTQAREGLDKWAGETISRNVSGLLKSLVGGIFGRGEGTGKPDGTKGNPFFTRSVEDRAKGAAGGSGRSDLGARPASGSGVVPPDQPGSADGSVDSGAPAIPSVPTVPGVPGQGGVDQVNNDINAANQVIGLPGKLAQFANQLKSGWLGRGNNALATGGAVADLAALWNLSKKHGKHRLLGILGGIAGGIGGFLTGGPIGAEYGFAGGSYLGGQFAAGGQMDLRKWNVVGERGPEWVAPGGLVIPMRGSGGRTAPVGGAAAHAVHVTVNHYGDVNNASDFGYLQEAVADGVMRRLAVTSPMIGVPALG
jgi:hypothetical protein